MSPKVLSSIHLVLPVLALASCTAALAERPTGPPTGPDPTRTLEAEPRPEIAEEPLYLEIRLAERALFEYHYGVLVEVIPVAVGQPTHPTPTGEYRIFQVDWNPDWTPPDSPWAADAEYTPPGHPDNPMGRGRLMFDPPYTIHGTEALDSLGEEASHGSVRMANDEVIDLARRVMEAGGAERPDRFYLEVVSDPTTMVTVTIPNPVPLVIED